MINKEVEIYNSAAIETSLYNACDWASFAAVLVQYC